MIRPGDIWGEQQGSSCERFIETAQSHDFKHAYKFIMAGGQAMRAYGVGRCNPAQQAVFLCEDNALRIIRNGSVRYNPPYGYGKDDEIIDMPIDETLDLHAQATPGYFVRGGTRTIVVGHSHDGWGTFLGERMHESQVNPWQREWFFPQPKPITDEEPMSLKFREAPLEEIVETHEAALALASASSISNVTVPNRPLFEALYGR